MLEAGQTQTVIARQIGINQSQVSRLLHSLGDRDSLLLPTIECLCHRLFVILRLFVLNYVSSGKILMFVPVPELLTGDLTRLDPSHALSLSDVSDA